MNEHFRGPTIWRILRSAGLFLVVVVLVSGCAVNKEATKDRTGSMDELSLKGIIHALDAQGVAANHDGTISESASDLSAYGYQFALDNSGRLQIYEYSNEAAAYRDVEQLQIATTYQVSDSPKIFAHDRFVVIYYGADPRVEGVLTNLLGSRVI